MCIKIIECTDLQPYLSDILKIEKLAFTYDAWSKNTFENLANSDSMHIIIAINSQNKLIGYLIYQETLDFFHIQNLAVAECFRGQGVARGLLEKLYGTNLEGKDPSFSATNLEEKIPIFLEVAVNNLPAIKLYESAGFEILEKKKKYYNPPGIDALVMRKNF
ncbi:MAG: GNAT family N-acetyltransferase [Bifidobacteriaceae bacterium]|jgi:ribosomal-protein-alanine N-acetyltransferase|nr:GNAT family N-acetyltransferase [Bifidobacteriaceae bacterium]